MIAITATKSLNPEYWFCKICQTGTCRMYNVKGKKKGFEACSDDHAWQWIEESGIRKKLSGDSTKIEVQKRIPEDLLHMSWGTRSTLL